MMFHLPSPVRHLLHRAYQNAERKEHQLLYLFLEITRLCNLTCRHCGSDCTSNHDGASLSTKSWIKILEHLAETFNPAPTIVLTGGEPLLHPDFRLILKKLNELHFRWGIVSNGYALNAEMIKLLQQYAVYSITVSLDGTGENHNWLRGRSESFERVCRALKFLSNMQCEKDVVTCVNPRNIDELDAIARILIDRGVASWRLFRIFPAGRARNNDDLLLSVTQTRKMLDWISDKRSSYRKQGLNLNYSCEGWLPFSIDSQVRTQPFFCRAGINIASILCDGTITGCSNNSSRFYEGNIIKDSFAYVWNNGFGQFRNRDWLQSTDCGGCRHVKRCQGSSIHLWRENPQRPEFCYMDCYR